MLVPLYGLAGLTLTPLWIWLGTGWYGYGAYGPPYGYWPGGLGLLLLIIVIVLALGGRL